MALQTQASNVSLSCPVLSSGFLSYSASYDVANSIVSEEAESAALLLVRKQ